MAQHSAQHSTYCGAQATASDSPRKSAQHGACETRCMHAWRLQPGCGAGWDISPCATASRKSMRCCHQGSCFACVSPHRVRVYARLIKSISNSAPSTARASLS
jgi:hypothetical protein